MYKSRGWSRRGVTVTEKVCGSPTWEGWEGGRTLIKPPVLNIDQLTNSQAQFYICHIDRIVTIRHL